VPLEQVMGPALERQLELGLEQALELTLRQGARERWALARQVAVQVWRAVLVRLPLMAQLHCLWA
jgi:hypothetical protein